MRKKAVSILLLAVIIAVIYRFEPNWDTLPSLSDIAGNVNQKEKVLILDEEPSMLPKAGVDPSEPPNEEQDSAPAATVSDGSDEEETGEYGELELQLAEGFQSREGRFSVAYSGDRDELSANMTSIIRSALQSDHYVAYILESYVYTIRSFGKRSTITVEARYRESIEETAAVDKRVEQIMQSIISNEMSDHEKVKAIHDWIVTNVEYDQSLSYYTAYNALALGEAVCQGYSLLAHKMLERAGIPVLIAEGSVNTGEHAWNMVQLDGVWYHLDVTWDDPVGAQDSRIRYNYYLKTDEELRADHQWTKTYPKADISYADTLRGLETAGTADEKQRFGKLKLALGLHWLEPEYTVSGETALRDAIQAAVRSRTNQLQFRYTDADDFEEELKASFNSIRGNVGYRASYEPYGGDGSLLVSLNLVY